MTEVNEYRRKVREVLDRTFEAMPPLEDGGDGSSGQLLHIAIEHRLMHAETLAYMFHRMPFERKRGAAAVRAFEGGAFAPDRVGIPAGRVTLGLRRDSGRFGWDNEFEAHALDVPEFAIEKYKVTNARFLRFLQEGGYDERAFWSAAGWEWKSALGISHPAFWVRRGNGWAYRSMFHEVPLPLDWPVYVSHAEANAYARWAGRALPTEAQWHRAAYASHGGGQSEYPWADGLASAAGRLPSSGSWDPAPVNAGALSESAFGVVGMIANGWEWTSTEFAPFPGFRPFASYPGYSAQFFDGKHYVLKGGSVRTSACMLRRSFRNWFQPHYQYVYAGFRCAGDSD